MSEPICRNCRNARWFSGDHVFGLCEWVTPPGVPMPYFLEERHRPDGLVIRKTSSVPCKAFEPLETEAE